MANSVYFRKIRTSNNGNTVSIVCSDQPVESIKQDLLGFSVASSSQNQIRFGILSLRDPKTGKVLTKDHPTIVGLQSKLNVGDLLPGFKFSDSNIKNQDGEDTDLFWIEPA